MGIFFEATPIDLDRCPTWWGTGGVSWGRFQRAARWFEKSGHGGGRFKDISHDGLTLCGCLLLEPNFSVILLSHPCGGIILLVIDQAERQNPVALRGSVR